MRKESKLSKLVQKKRLAFFKNLLNLRGILIANQQKKIILFFC